VANFTFADLTGTLYKTFEHCAHTYTLNDANVGNMDAHYRRVLSIIKQKKNPDDPQSWISGLHTGLSGDFLYRPLGASAGPDDYGACFRSLGASDDDAPCYRSMSGGGGGGAPNLARSVIPMPPSDFEEAEAVEAALGISKAMDRALKLSVPDPKSTDTDLVATLYKRFAVPFGSVPAEKFLRGIVNSLLTMQAECEAPQDGKKGPKTSDGLVESRHSERAIKLFKIGDTPVDTADIASSLKHYNTNANELIPKEDPDSDEDATPLGKCQKLKSCSSPSSNKDSDDED
jgi:hypothetical protein